MMLVQNAIVNFVIQIKKMKTIKCHTNFYTMWIISAGASME